MAPYSDGQQWALVILPKVTGLVSLFFSCLVIFTVVNSKSYRSKTYHRLLLGISCVDVSSSFWLGLSTWPIPSETGIKGASGTTATCSVQGFFTQFGIASSFYNASLSIFYLLVIRYGWREDQIRRIEPLLHAVPILWGLSTAIAGIPLTIFNSANLWCWIAPYQDRGTNADLYRWVFFYGPLWIMIGIVTGCVIFIFHHVLSLEAKSAQYVSSWGLDAASRVGNNLVSNDENENENENDTSVEEKVEEANEAEEENVTEDEEIKAGDINWPLSALFASNEERNKTASVDSEAFKKVSSRLQLPNARSFRRSMKAEKLERGYRRSRQVAYQCLRYAGCFYFTWIALTVGFMCTILSLCVDCEKILPFHGLHFLKCS